MAHHNRTPQSVLDAPVSQSLVIWPLPKKRRLRLFESTKFGPYTSPKVRKVRRGRKARWNR